MGYHCLSLMLAPSGTYGYLEKAFNFSHPCGRRADGKSLDDNLQISLSPSKTSTNLCKVLHFRTVVLKYLGLRRVALAEAISRFLAVARWRLQQPQAKSHLTIIFVSFKTKYKIKSNERRSGKASHESSHLPKSFNFHKIRLKVVDTYLSFPVDDRSLQPYRVLAFTLLAERQSKRLLLTYLILL
jgi:hypothetical protein